VTRRRLDAELVRRRLVTSREQAQSAIAEGRVLIGGVVATKAATQVEESQAIDVTSKDEDDYVSRGAYKLIGALDSFAIDVRGRRALDAGASTGGFTQVLLERGVAQVIAVDVGYGQLAWPVRSHDAVTVLERTNVRYLTPDDVPYPPDLIVADLSFISLTVVLPALLAVAAPEADFLLMVKPQFEVGKDDVGQGVVTDPDLRVRAVWGVVEAGLGLGLELCGVVASPLPGPKGNVEYFLWMTNSAGDVEAPTGDDGRMHPRIGRSATPDRIDDSSRESITAAIRTAVEEGPR
jgi:23S rRNA (cytidine1920-2'-O)/16S rRNA (cytidine1409-2'-O)-methyltransferase